LPPTLQQVHFLVAPYEWRESARVHRIEAADAHILPDNAIGLDGCANSLECDATERFAFKVAPNKPSCASSNDHFSGLSHGLQSRR
jgi:hypothetical protein